MIDNFDAGIAPWSATLKRGGVAGCTLSVGEGVGGSGALRVDYVFDGPETNHILYRRDVDLRLSGLETISFDVKGAGEPTCIFLFLCDSQGRCCIYGPHGSNPDFTTGYADWHTLRVDLERDYSCQGGDADFSDIRQVGFFIWSNGPRVGTVWFDNLVCSPAAVQVKVLPPEVTPNADGINDTCTVLYIAPDEARVTLEVLSPEGEVIATLLRDAVPERPAGRLTWDGLLAGRPAPEGQYTFRATFSAGEPREVSAKVSLCNPPPVPPVRYTVEPFFPIGVWFAGAPSVSGLPNDPESAKRYYDTCFADLAAHGFNTVAVPKCPDHLWKTLLQSAAENGIRVILEVSPLVRFVNSHGPLIESEVKMAVRGIVDDLSGYDSLLRYEIRDEPPVQVIPKWLIVQRLLAAADPKHPAFSCFSDPNSLAHVTAQTVLAEAVYDNYPNGGATPLNTLGNFLELQDAFVKASRGNTRWAVLPAFGRPSPPSYRYPTPEELRAMTYLSLASGAKGIFYFLYQYVPKDLHGLTEVGPDFSLRRQPLWEPTCALVRELGRLSPLLLSLETAAPPAAVEGDVRVGSFKDPGGKPVLIVASKQPAQEVTARVAVTQTTWTEALTGETLTATDGVLAVSLGRGAGLVLVGK